MDDPNWRNYLVLLDIIDYLCAPQIHPDNVGHLWHLIAEHHSAFKELYPYRLLTPKFHYMVHMPEWILKYVTVLMYYVLTVLHLHPLYSYGPLTRMWTMRYEAKHRYFKRWCSIMGNFKNIAKTLANHHQKYLCYLLSTNSFLSPTTSIGPGIII